MTLQDILQATEAESAQRRRQEPSPALQQRIADLPATLGFARHLAAKFGVIAEIKVKSPSMGIMSATAEATAEVAHRFYQEHPIVTAISVLTQAAHFGGSEQRLRTVRRETTKPILRKDFVQDEYEVYFSRAIGADAILLMANVVTDPVKFKGLHDLANELGMDVLCEVHSREEQALLPDSTRICGINARDFKRSGGFVVSEAVREQGRDISTDLATFDLFPDLNPKWIKVAESGMAAENIAAVLAKYPFDAALIGTSLLRGGQDRIKAELDRLRPAIAAVPAERINAH